MTWRLTCLCVSLSAGPAGAQFGVPVVPNAYAGVPTQGAFLPNYYNRQTQPLSPYLNLLRGTNPGVNYYYGVRPGLPSGGQPYPGAVARNGPAASPTYTYVPGLTGQLEPGEGYVLPPAGHTNTYGNYFGTAGSSLPGYATGRGAVVPGIANTRPQPAPQNPRR
jgi:hypothetical protein